MTVLTPASAGQVPPDGIPNDYGSGGAVAAFTLTETVTADFGPTSDAFFTPSVGGLYQFAGFDEVISACGGAANLQVDIVSPTLGVLDTFNLNLSASPQSGGSLSAAIAIQVADGPITIERTVAGFAAPNGSYRLSVKAYLLA